MAVEHLARDLGFEQLPKVAGTFKGRAIVVGSARCAWDDLAVAREAWPEADLVAVKQVGMYLPGIRHWMGCHGERFQWMVPLRRDGYYFRGHDANGVRQVFPQRPGVTGVMVHAEKAWPLVDVEWPGDLKGTSACFAARVCCALGYEAILLAGVPLDGSGRFYDPPGVGTDLSVVNEQEWHQYAAGFQGRVRSVSGRTRNFLGGL